MRRIVVRIGGALGIVALLGLVVAGPASGHADAARIARYTASARIFADGRVHIRETVAYAYGARGGGAPAVRRLPSGGSVGTAWAWAYRLTHVTVGGPERGVRGQVSDDADGGKVIRVRDPHPYGRRVYTIAYDVAGLVDEVAGQDMFGWDFLGGGWGVPVDRASVTVRAPARITDAVCSSGNSSCDVDRKSGTTAVFGVRRLDRPVFGADITLARGGVRAVPPVELGPSIAAYGVDAWIRPDGTVHLTETIGYDFSDRPRHGIERVIPYRRHVSATRDRLYTYTGIAVTSPDLPTPTTVTDQGGTKIIRIGQADRTHTGGPYRYVIQYELRGALTSYRDHDELYWNFIGDTWGVPIDGATVTVHAPAGITRVACYAGAPASRRPCTTARARSGTATFTQRALPTGAGLTAAVALPKGAVRVPPPTYVSRPGLFRPTLLGLGLALAALLFISVAYVRHRSARPCTRPHGPVTAPPGPIDAGRMSAGAQRLLPGHAAVLLGVPKERIAAATLLDLAERGYLRIRPVATDEHAEHDGAAQDWVLTRTDAPAGTLWPDEADLLGWLFEDADEVAMSEIARRRSAVVMSRRLTAGLTTDCLGRHWLRRAATGSGPGWLMVLVGGVAGCLVLVGLLQDKVPAWTDGLGYLPFAVLLAGIAFAVFASRPALTAEGSALRAALRAYRRHLETGGIAEAYGRDLPYAVIFGLARTYERLYVTAHGAPDVAWYHGPDTPHFASVFTTTATANLSPATSSSGSSSSGSSSGFSGGSVGGGGGGGGGGTW